MENRYWQKQTKDKPLFPDLIWSRPENKLASGKLLIIGGNSHGFAAPAEAYQAALKAGVGIAHVLMPQAVKSLAGKLLDTIDYAPSTISGSFSKAASAELIDHATWADAVLVAGDLGRNSETAITLENFLNKHSGQVTLCKDAADYASLQATAALERLNTLLVVNIAQLQKIFAAARLADAISYSMDLLRLIEVMHNLGEKYPAIIIVKHSDQLIVSSGGQVSSTLTDIDNEDFWRVNVATRATVWWLQNPSKPFEALTTSLIAD